MREPTLSIASLDGWRGTAALGVVAFHVCDVTPNLVPLIAGSPLYALSLLGYLGVPIFFVISGFCITNAAATLIGRPDGPRRFALARLRRIYPAYAAVTLLAFGVAAAATFAVSHHIVRTSYIAHLDPLGQPPLYYFATLTLTQVPFGFDPIVPAFWSLSYEVAFYVIVLAALALVVRLRATPAALIGLLHGVTAVALLLIVVGPRASVFPFDLWPQFGLGVVLWDALRNPRSVRPFAFFGAVAAAIAVATSIHPAAADIGSVNTRLAFGVSLGFALFLRLTASIDERLAKLPPFRVLAAVGTFSYSLYLAHMLAIGIVLQAFKRYRLDEHDFAFAYVAGTAVAVAFGYGVYRVAEAPFRRSTRAQLAPSPK